MLNDIRSILKEHGRLPVDAQTIAEDADLYALGLTSHASVNLMVALESKFDVEFPERLLRRKTFESIRNMEEALKELVGQKATT